MYHRTCLCRVSFSDVWRSSDAESGYLVFRCGVGVVLAVKAVWLDASTSWADRKIDKTPPKHISMTSGNWNEQKAGLLTPYPLL